MQGPMLLVCGYGSRGGAVARAFLGRGLEPAQISIIDLSPEKARAGSLHLHRSVCGDASEPNKLRLAGVGEVDEVIICVDDEAAAAVIEAVRQVNETIYVSALIDHPTVQNAVKSAGANSALNLADIAGQLLAESAFLPQDH